jgi:hypothetical protein
MDTRTTLLFKDSTFAKHMCPLHDNYVVAHVCIGMFIFIAISLT